MSLTLSCRLCVLIEKRNERERNPSIAGDNQGEEGFELTKRPPHSASSLHKLSASVLWSSETKKDYSSQIESNSYASFEEEGDTAGRYKGNGE